MTDRRIRKVVILGGGTAGWMTAAALAKVNQPPQFEVVLLESEEIGIIGVGEATIPTIHWFNGLADVGEAELFRETRATCKLGIEFAGWNGDGSRYFHPFGRYGGGRDASMFYHRFIRAQLSGATEGHPQYSLTTEAAYAGKFAAPAADTDSILSTLGYAYHFDASLYAAFLRKRAESRCVRRIEGRVVEIRQDPESGFVRSLKTQRDEVIEGDLFIDCSGLRALLIEETLKTGFEDWSGWLPCDRALAVPSERVADPVPYTRSTAHAAGWQWRIPLQHRTGNGLVYSSAFLSDDEAAAILHARLDGKALADPRPIRFLAGMRRKAWNKNVVAIGLSSGFLEPLESTSIHLIQSGIAKLLALFPTRDCHPETAAQFNRVFAADVHTVRDFLVLHYHYSTGRHEPFWEHCRQAPLPEGLAYKVAHFTRTGRIVIEPEELFKEASWFAVMMGQGLKAADYNPLLDAVSPTDNKAHLQRVRHQISAALAAMRPHENYIQLRLQQQ
jgi:tryptophan halogenase